MKVGIIGSGPSGLVLAKELREVGIEVTCFEKSDSYGGVFYKSYQDAQFTSSNMLSTFSDMTTEKEVPRFWYFDEYLDYLGQFIEKFNLKEVLNFNTEVVTVKESQESGKRQYIFEMKNNKTNETYEEAFDRVAICAGTHQRPNLPSDDYKEFSGQIIHSKNYSSPSEYAGKKVLIIGGGESASDISKGISKVAQSACLSVRGQHGVLVPRTMFDGTPLDLDTSRSHYSLPTWFGAFYSVIVFIRFFIIGFVGSFFAKKGSKKYQQLKVYQEFALKNLKGHCNTYTKFGTKNISMIEGIVEHGLEYRPGIDAIKKDIVRFVDGSEFSCDVIILATGYRNAFPFLQQNFSSLAEKAITSRSLYKHAMDPKWGLDFFWCGFARPAFGSVLPMAEIQARWYAQLCLGTLQIPSPEKMEEIVKHDKSREERQFYKDASRITSLTDYLSYLDEIGSLIGCRPSLWKLFWTDHRVWWLIMLGPINGVQYRLNGPGSRKTARQVLIDTPVIWRFGIHLVFLHVLFKLLSFSGLRIFKAPGER